MDKMMAGWWRAYRTFVKGKAKLNLTGNGKELKFWQDKLFFNLLVYCLPFSFIALIPGIIMSIKDGYTLIACVDTFSFLFLIFITFSNQLQINVRKILLVTLFYILAVFLINSLGYIGPGIFYLFFITILIALIFPIRAAYWSIVANTLLLLGFALNIKLSIFKSVLIKEYDAGEWIAFSSNLTFLSLVTIALIHRLFKSLQSGIDNQNHLQEKYKSIFDNSPLPMWVFDTHTLHFLDVNQATVMHYGYSKEEFLQMTIRNIRPSDKVHVIENIVEKNKVSGVFYDGVAEHTKKGGENIYVKIESNLLELNGRLVRLVLATDITEQLKNELEVFEVTKKIKESEASLKALFESAIDGFVLLDAKQNIKLFNYRALESMRFNKNQQMFETGRSIFDFVESSRLKYFREIISKVYTGEVIDYDRRFRIDDGSINWIRYMITPVYEGELVVGACITGRDITVRKLYLKNLEDQNKTFKEISWMQSHMVRAPLARIMGLIPLFQSATDENEKVEISNYINISVHELDDIIKDITLKSNDIVNKYNAPAVNEGHTGSMLK